MRASRYWVCSAHSRSERVGKSIGGRRAQWPSAALRNGVSAGRVWQPLGLQSGEGDPDREPTFACRAGAGQSVSSTMIGGGNTAAAAAAADCAARGVPRACNEPAARDPHESSEDVIYTAKIMVVSQGQLLAGKYRVERVLGQGGMGVVLAARHVDLDEDVAIKLLLPEAMASTEGVARFEREARAAVKIKSEHVARVMDVGRLENGTPYMVMELLRGLDLQALLRERGPLPLAEVADYLLQAGEAIEEAHGLGIVHRDLKPPNLFFTQRPDGSSCIKVLDFGISKLKADSGDQRMTATSAIMGSPLYMSPEQLMSARDVDQRTDIRALGVICFELLAGTPPFVAETLPQLCMAISLHPPAALRSYRPDLPVEVESMVARCLNKNPDQRYAGVAQLAAELVSTLRSTRGVWPSGSNVWLRRRASVRATLRPYSDP